LSHSWEGSGTTLVQTQQRRIDNNPQAVDKVYVMIGAKAVGLGNLVMGCCVIAAERLCVLFVSQPKS